MALLLAGSVSAVAPGQDGGCDRVVPDPFTPPSGDPFFEVVPLPSPVGVYGRVAVVVEDRIYPAITAGLNAYIAGLEASGYGHVVVVFRGDWEDLRTGLQSLYDPQNPSTLVGCLFIGNLPYVIWFRTSDDQFITDTYFGDLTGSWGETALPGVFDYWSEKDEEHPIEIWISRVRADNLPVLLEDEGDIINAYLSRNSETRMYALDPSGRALAYVEEVFEEVASDRRDNVLKAYDDVELVCGYESGPTDCEPECQEHCDTTCKQDYLERLIADPPYQFIDVTCHGGPDCLLIVPGAVHSMDYSTVSFEHPISAVGFELWACETCQYSAQDCLGLVAALNPRCSTLFAIGSTAVGYPEHRTLWDQLGNGQSVGDAIKALINDPGVGREGGMHMVVLGDGSLRRMPVTWTGQGLYANKWSDPGNWDRERVPVSGDDVAIGEVSEAVQADVGSFEYPAPVRSLTLAGGTSLEFPHVAEVGVGLRVRGPLTGGGAANSFITMGRKSRLDLQDGLRPGDLRGVSVTMGNATPSEPITVTVDGTTDRCALNMGENCTVTAHDITGDDSGSQDWAISGAVLNARDVEIWGQWTSTDGAVHAHNVRLNGALAVSGGTATCFWLSGSEDVPGALALSDSAAVDIERAPYYFGDVFPDVAEHQLLHGAGANLLRCTTTESISCGDRLVLGNHTRLGSTGAGDLTLDLSCELFVRSDFQNEFVYQGWDSRSVDFKVEALSPSSYPTQRVELFAPNFAPAFGSKPVIFVDVPCHAAARDLLLPAQTDPAPVPVVMANQFDNSAIDEGPRESWPAHSGKPAEAGYFRNVTVGAGRILEINTADGLLYYWGTRSIDQGATVELDGGVLAPTKYDMAIKPALATLYGDWNGDCVLTNAELVALQSAIAGGPSAYRSIMDYDCDGRLLAQVEVSAFLANMARQPAPECEGGGLLLGGGGMEEFGLMAGADEGIDDGASAAEPDVEALAQWLIQEVPPDELAAFIAQATVTAGEHAGDAVGGELSELLSELSLYLP